MTVNPAKWNNFTNHHKILKSLNILTSYCMVRNIMKGRPFRTIFWMIPTTLLAFSNYRNHQQLGKIIQTIVLHDDGRHIDLTFFDKSKIQMLDIACLSILNPDELDIFYQNTNVNLLHNMLPIQLDDYKISQTILLPVKATHVEDNVLLNRVVSGHYIDLRGQYN